MGKIIRIIALGIATLALAASAKRYQPFTPAERSAPPDALDRAVRVLTERGESVKTRDDGAGMVITEWRDLTQMGTTNRLRWTVSVSGGVVRVSSQCESRMEENDALSVNEWEACGNQPGDRTGEANAIADAIAR